MAAIRISSMFLASWMLLGTGVILTKCGETRQDKWDKSDHIDRIRDGVKGNNPPGKGFNQ